MKTIRLTQGRAAVVDDIDHPTLMRHKWYLQKTELPTITKNYAASKINGREILMHRFLMKALPGQSVDHRNGNGLDNRRANLRIASHLENMANKQPDKQRHAMGLKTSRYKGVYRRKCQPCNGEGGFVERTGPTEWEQYQCQKCGGTGATAWRAGITINGKVRSLGTHATEEAAARAYDAAALKAWGSWAQTNFTQEESHDSEKK